MQVVKGGLRAATHLRDSKRTLTAMSKIAALGTKYHLFFPIDQYEDGVDGDGNSIMKDDLRLTYKPGYTLDAAKLRTSWVALDNYEITETGSLKDFTGLNVWARIASVLYKAEEAAVKAKVEREAKAEAEATGKSMEEMSIALASKLRDVELEYEGNPDNGIYPTKQPLIKGWDVKMATEVLMVPIVAVNGVDKPDWTKAQVASFEPSNTKAQVIASLIDDANFHKQGCPYLEVIYDYGKGCTDKVQAGRAATFQGCSESMSLAVTDPEGWTANKNKLDNISKDLETMAVKNYSISQSKSTKEVMELLKNHISKLSLVLTKIDMEAAATAAVARDMVNLGLVKNVPKIQEQLLELAETAEAEAAAKEAAAAADVEIPAAISEAQTLTELVSAAEDAGVALSGEEQGNVDIDISEV